MFLFISILLFLSLSALILLVALFVHDCILSNLKGIHRSGGIICLMSVVIILELILAKTMVTAYKEKQGYEVTSSITKLERVRILNMTKPKHVYIDLVNLETGITCNRIYVSKHCNNQDMSDIGSEMGMEVTYLEYKNGESGIRYNTSRICD
jgi:hypothetical protein